MQKLSISEARKQFMKLPENTGADQVLAVTRRNREIMAVMTWELYEGLLETIDILSDPELMAAVKKGLEDIAAGNTRTIPEARKRLGL